LKCERFVDQLHAFPPDLVIWGLGINDAYKQIGVLIPSPMNSITIAWLLGYKR
jgi:hypothetical protein